MIEKISLEISNYWTASEYFTESNKRSGTVIAFDWENEYLTGLNTNIDLGDSELTDFKFDTFVDFLKKNNFTFVLGLRNIAFNSNPSEKWTNKLTDELKSNEIDYDEYVVETWPAPIPEFDVPKNIFILRYSYDEYSEIDKFAATKWRFKEFMKKSDWGEYYKDKSSEEKTRVIIFLNDIENLVLHGGYIK